ncbi:ankyrin repeat domain-containing protein [Streptomyces venezuelae]|uniref:Serine/threonine protein kinase n=1 Tax=Streptomyces venezuelae TaxID=54571 RepID=A0A5P2C8X0_STRVZ|nr:ankyrin repeat domain-containing protein [Streptomyces venezuelae]QES39176.1 serine/threonine protein kinase [Streptomyces venezuelae]
MNRRRRKKLTPRLVFAASQGETATVRSLLRSGLLHPELPDADGTTALYAASVHGAADTVRVLLRAGALPDTESLGVTEGTPLCAAAAWGHVDTVRELLAHGADPNLREDLGTGRTPLRWARDGAGGPHPETEAALLAAGATEDAAGATGNAAAAPRAV